MIEQKIGGVQGVGGTGLVSATFDILGTSGDTNADTLILGPTNGASNGSGATGYKVVLTGDASVGLSGTVEYRDGADAALVEFNGFELFSFTDFKNVAATNNDLVDATAVTSDLTLNTGAGNDTVNFGSGDDTFVIGKRDFGADTADGGAGDDTLDLSALTGAGRSPLTFKGTNLFQTTALVVERTDATANSVTFTDFEKIVSGGDNDVFTSGYAAEPLKSIEMGGGNDVFGWLVFDGDDLDIDAGSRDDTVKIGGNSGSSRTGLLNGAVAGGAGIDTLALGETNGHSGATGFKVVIENDAESSKSFKGAVQYTDGLGGTTATFTGFEALAFNGRIAATSNDHVDATAATRNLTLDTGAGDDTVNFGSGNDTFVIGNRNFGADVVDGGAGHDTMDLLSGVGGHLATSFSVKGTNLFQNAPIVATSGANSVSFTGFEVIKTGAHADSLVGGYADTGLKSIEMGGGNDVFGWLTFNGDFLNIDAGSGNDTVAIGGNSGSGRTGLMNGTVAGGTGTDTLALGVTNGQSGATGFKVVIADDAESGKSFKGTVQYTNGTTDGLGGTKVDFTGFEALTFASVLPATNNDHVDATAATQDLTLDTGAGDDVVNFGSGNDTFVVGTKNFGANVVDGGAGHDTLELSNTPYTFNGTNFSGKKAMVVEGAVGNSVTFTDFEAIESGNRNDVFTNGYAARELKSIDMGWGNDVFAWATKENDQLDINAGGGADTVAIGGSQGAGGTGLIDGTVDGGDGYDTLRIRYNNTSGDKGEGFNVTFTGDTDGEVTYRDNANGPTTTFESFENIVFEGFKRRSDLNDVVDARESKATLTIDTAAGDDTIIVAGGKQTLTGGLDADTFAFMGKFGKDTITDFNVGEDMIALEADTTIRAVYTSGSNTVIGTSKGWIILEDVAGLDIDNIDSIIDTTFDFA